MAGEPAQDEPEKKSSDGPIDNPPYKKGHVKRVAALLEPKLKLSLPKIQREYALQPGEGCSSSAPTDLPPTTPSPQPNAAKEKKEGFIGKKYRVAKTHVTKIFKKKK